MATLGSPTGFFLFFPTPRFQFQSEKRQQKLVDPKKRREKSWARPVNEKREKERWQLDLQKQLLFAFWQRWWCRLSHSFSIDDLTRAFRGRNKRGLCEFNQRSEAIICPFCINGLTTHWVVSRSKDTLDEKLMAILMTMGSVSGKQIKFSLLFCLCLLLIDQLDQRLMRKRREEALQRCQSRSALLYLILNKASFSAKFSDFDNDRDSRESTFRAHSLALKSRCCVTLPRHHKSSQRDQILSMQRCQTLYLALSWALASLRAADVTHDTQFRQHFKDNKTHYAQIQLTSTNQFSGLPLWISESRWFCNLVPKNVAW